MRTRCEAYVADTGIDGEFDYIGSWNDSCASRMTAAEIEDYEAEEAKDAIEDPKSGAGPDVGVVRMGGWGDVTVELECDAKYR